MTVNARAPLKILALEDCWEHVHPDVVYIPDSFAGYPYWMAFTPYPLMNERLENPTIRASYDGLAWENVAGLPDPIVPPPDLREFHHADPELLYHAGRLYLIYGTFQRGTNEVTFKSMNCKSDLHWSETVTVHEDTGAVSPSFHIDSDTFHEWFIRMTPQDSGHSELLHRYGSDLVSLGNESKCLVDIPGYVPWHVDVLAVDDHYEALVAAFRYGTNSTRTRLFHLSSSDGLSFKLSRRAPLLEPSSRGWDNRMIYRSTFLRKEDGTYRVWYSAASWGCHFGIGLLEGTLDSLREPITQTVQTVRVPSYIHRLPGELEGWLRYEIKRRLPLRALSFLPTEFFLYGQR